MSIGKKLGYYFECIAQWLRGRRWRAEYHRVKGREIVRLSRSEILFYKQHALELCGHANAERKEGEPLISCTVVKCTFLDVLFNRWN